MVCYGVSLILSIIPIFLNRYGSSKIYCWMKVDPDSGVSLDILFFYGPLVIVLLLVFFFYGRLYLKLRKTLITEAFHKAIMQFALYPFGMFLCFVFAAINRFYNFPYRHGSMHWLIVLHIFLR